MVVSSPKTEKLNRKCVVVSVGLYPGNARVALMSVGLYDGDVVILVNSEPRSVPESVIRGRRRQPTEAMESLRKFISEAFEGLNIEVRDVWLDPKLGLMTNVAMLRSIIEGYVPCDVIIAMAGGLRWLSSALMFLAIALNTVGRFISVRVDKVFTMLEEESPSIRALFKGVERFIEWPFIPAMAELTREEYSVLKLVGEGVEKAKYIHKEYNSRFCKSRYKECISMPTVERILVKLRRKNLVKFEASGKAYRYYLTPVSVMLVGKPMEQPQNSKNNLDLSG